mmetsp:Transcript_24764/g.32346  ORF Transcript_24764/g.32346 Transcript_24764/m.32346 type:complete len:219 (+) Transcript_24764:94-750(+)
MGGGISRKNISSLPQFDQNPLLNSVPLRVKEKNIPGSFLMVGLSGAGKTSLIQILQRSHQRVEFQDYIPQPAATVKSTPCICKSGDRIFEVLDNPGRQRQRISWLHNLKEIKGVVFVLDTVDKLRLPLAYNEILKITRTPDLIKVPLLVAMTKQDLVVAEKDIQDIELRVRTLLTKESKKAARVSQSGVQKCSAAQPESVHQALNWLLDKVTVCDGTI